MGLKQNKALLLAFAATASFTASPPAQAAENLQCVEAIRTEAVDKMIFAAYRAHKLPEALSAGPGRQVSLCAEQNQWSPAARESAAAVFLYGVSEAGLKKEFLAHKLADRLVVWLSNYVTELPDYELAALASGDLIGHHMQVAVKMLLVNGTITERQVTVDTSSMIGEYLTARANLRFHRARFKAE